MEPETSSFATESDVEQKFIFPVLTEQEWLGFPADTIKTKHYLAESTVAKGTSQRAGYIPDYSIWISGLPVAVIEAKSPKQKAELGYREAQEYALFLNKKFPTGINPAKYVVSTNGITLLAGYWDQNPSIEIPVHNLVIGNAFHQKMVDFLEYRNLEHHANEINKKRRQEKLYLPVSEIGGAGILRARIQFNSFAEQVSTLLLKYFESDNPSEKEEILEKAYVPSTQNTQYNRVFENFLRENTPTKITGITKELTPTPKKEPVLSRMLASHSSNSATGTGKLQIILGSVGSGKTTFIERYYSYLMPPEIRQGTVWTLHDFNKAPSNLENIEELICDQFIEQVNERTEDFDVFDHETLKTIFRKEIKQLDGAYKYLRENDPQEYLRRQASDLRAWMDDKKMFAKALARHLQGERNKGIVSVFRDRDQQLAVFQVAEWFKNQTRAVCLISLRDETYERYKSEPPLDAFQNAVHFYIKPPRFSDTVKKRLELSLDYLSKNTNQLGTYELPSGATVRFPQTQLGHFIRSLYADLFQSNRRVTWLLEALAGRNIRRALQMFSQILLSGHLNEADLTRTIMSNGVYHIPENLVIKILMRTDYLLFSEDSGFTSNIFACPDEMILPNNLLISEILFFLYRRRKKVGDARVEGYFTVRQISEHLERLGFPMADTLLCAKYILQRGLITADHMRITDLAFDDAIRLHASGFVHLRILCERIEYLASCALVTPLSNKQVAVTIAGDWQMEPGRNDTTQRKKVMAVRKFHRHLKNQYTELENSSAFFAENAEGSQYVLSSIQKALSWRPQGKRHSQGQLI